MKKTILCAFLFALVLLPLCALAADAVVFLDGTGETPGAYTSLADAAAALPAEGGTVVVCGVTDTPSDKAVNLPAKPLTLTSVHDGVDYAETNGAYLGVKRTIVLGADTLFEQITIKQTTTSTTYGNLYAAGHHLTMGEGVTAVANETSGIVTPLYGGNSVTATYPTHITVMSGDWNIIYGGGYAGHNGNTRIDFAGGSVNHIYGGNRGGAFSGNTEIYMTGGTVKGNIAGGNAPEGKAFTGNTSVNITGGTVEYLSTAAGVVGGSVGKSGGTAYTHTGDISIHIGGDAAVYATVLGASRYTNITTHGDISVTVDGSADLYRHLYGGGYGNVTTGEGGIRLTLGGSAVLHNPAGASDYICAGANSGSVTGDLHTLICENACIQGNVYNGGYSGNVTGNSEIVMTGGEVGVTLSLGSRGGTVDGSGAMTLSGGRLPNASYGVRLDGSANVAASHLTGSATVTLDGAEIAGSITAGRVESSSILLRSGSLSGGTDAPAAVDLTGDKALSLGGDYTLTGFTGGGRLTLAAASHISAATASGAAALVIAGEPVANQVYLTVEDAASDLTLTYAPQDDEDLVRAADENLTFTVVYPERFDTTHIRVNYYNPHGTEETQPKIVLSTSTPSDPDRVSVTLTKGTENGIPYAEADLAPGNYYYKVYYGSGGSDYEVQYFIVSGKEASHTYTTAFEPYVADSYMETVTAKTTAEMMDAFFNNADLTGFAVAPTPTFTEHTDEDRSFMTNAELLAYIDTLSAPYLYKFAFDLDTEYNNKMPVLVFTKDEIPGGATLKEIGDIVRAGGVREIWQIDGGIHGNEPTGQEAALWFATELCGAYGEELLDHFGAIVILPDVCPDNSQRFMRNYADGINANRDLMGLVHTAAQKQSYVYQCFMPTVFVDLHEDYANETIDTSDYSVNAIVDIRFDISGTPNSGIGDVNGIANGTNPLTAHRDYRTIHTLISEVAACGLRTCGYYAPQYNPGVSTSYAKTRGAYAFLFETMRIWSGKQRYARSVFAAKTALETLAAIICDADGAFAEEVARGRAATPVTVYDENNLFATKMARTGTANFTVTSPSAYLTGKIKNASRTETFRDHDTVTGSRPMATGYILPADTEHLEEILALCDLHGLKYLRLKAGTALTLRRYTAMSGSAAALGTAEEITFADGAYLFLTDSADAYLVAYLFEPDSMAGADDTKISLVQMELLTADDALYRSETSYLRTAVADLIYDESALPFDVIKSGETHTALGTRAGETPFALLQSKSDVEPASTLTYAATFVPAYLYEIVGDYILPLDFTAYGNEISFTGAAEKTYALSASPLVLYGDANGDGEITLKDALRILRALASPSAALDRAAADVSHSASLELLDMLKTLRIVLN